MKKKRDGTKKSRSFVSRELFLLIKSGLLLLFLLLGMATAWAEPAKVIVKGCGDKACVYNSIRGQGQRMFATTGDVEDIQEILIPEEQCRDLLYLITNDITSWIRVLPGERVEVTVRENGLEFTGDEAKINNYLFDWTRKFYFGKSNNMLFQIQMMMSVIPMSKKGMPNAKEFYTPEYMQWVAGWKERALEDLESRKINDQVFVKEQRRRINYAWWELQFANYRVAKNIGDVPAEAMAFVHEVKLEDVSIQEYPGYSIILSEYLDMAERSGKITYISSGYLNARAGLIENEKLREEYILNELFLIFKMRGFLYQGEQLLASVESLIISEEGKKKFVETRKMYEELVATDMMGHPAVDFVFESYQGDSLCLQQFRGKYLLIDIWATWCTPCKFQIPYLKKLEEALRGKNISFLSISTDKQKDKELWRSLIKQFGLEHGNCAIAPDAFNHPMFEKFRVKAIPRFVLVDPAGKVVMSSARFPSDPLLKMQLEELL